MNFYIKNTHTTFNLAIASCVAGLIMLMTGCSSMSGLMGPQTFSITQTQILDALVKRFPLDQKILEIFDVKVTNPKIALDGATNRINSSLALEIKNPLLSKALSGALSVSSGLKYDASTNAIQLSEPRVENLKIDGVPAKWADQMNKIGALVIERSLKDAPVYTFKPEQLKLGGTLFKPGNIQVQNTGVAITLLPQTK